MNLLCQNSYFVSTNLHPQRYRDVLRRVSKQAKILGIAAIIRSGSAFNDPALLMRLVSEILINRVAADKDDLDVFILLAALQHVRNAQMPNLFIEMNCNAINLLYLYLKLATFISFSKFNFGY